MKKVVVVVGSGRTVTFEGEKLQVDNNSSSYLIVRDMDKPEHEQDLAVFKSWRYWREIKENESVFSPEDIKSCICVKQRIMGLDWGKKATEVTYGEMDIVRIINKNGLCVAVLYILPDGNLAEDSWMHSKDSDWYKRNKRETPTE